MKTILHQRKVWPAFVVTALAALLLMIYTSNADKFVSSGMIYAQTKETASKTVTVVSPRKQTLSWTVSQPGTVQPYEAAPIIAKLPGYVAKVNVDIGSQVKKGDILVELSIPELTAEVDQKKAILLQYEAEMKQAASSIDVALARQKTAQAGISEAEAGQANVEANANRWQSELSRIEALVSQMVIDVQSLDEAKKQYQSAVAMKKEVAAKVESAKAVFAESSAYINRAKADVEAAKAKVNAANADLRRAQELLAYSKLTAPFDGLITQRNVHVGHFLQAGAKSEAILTVTRIDKLRVQFDVPESIAYQIKPNINATVNLVNSRQMESKVSRVSGVISPENRTMRCEIDLDNQDNNILSGSFVQIKVMSKVVDAFVVPINAIQYADETVYGFFVVDGKISKLRLKIGQTENNMIELIGKKPLIGSGSWEAISDQDQLVSNDLGSITNGQIVTIEKK